MEGKGIKITNFLFIVLLHLVVVYFAYYWGLLIYDDLFNATLTFLDDYIAFLAIFLSVYLSFMWKELFAHGYRYYLSFTPILVVKNLLIAMASVAAIFLMTLFFRDFYGVVPWKLTTFIGVGIASVCIAHYLVYRWIKYLSRLGYFHKKVLSFGIPDSRFDIKGFFQDMGETKDFCGCLEHDGKQWVFLNNNGEKFKYGTLSKAIFRNRIGEILLFLNSRIDTQKVEEITAFCRREMISYFLVPDLSLLPHTNYWRRFFTYIPSIEYFSTYRDSFGLISIKRILDIAFSLIIMILFAPFALMIALIIKLQDGGPIFYFSDRVGKDGRIIQFFKFRTMSTNAEKIKEQFMHLNERADGPLFKMKDDPRVTPFGRFLRKTNLDEMPQFINVLKGDISIIGPRPHLPQEVEAYGSKDFLRLECMPGIICLPQLLPHRDEIGFREWIEYDLLYRRRWSPILDMYVFRKAVKLMAHSLLTSFFIK